MVKSHEGTVEIPVTIKGTCRFVQVSGGVKLTDDATGKLLSGKDVEVEYKDNDKKVKMTTDSSGFLKLKTEKFVNLYFDGNNFYAPCAYEGIIKKSRNNSLSKTFLGKYNVIYFTIFLFTLLIIWQNFNYIKDKFNIIKYKKERYTLRNESEKYEADYFVHTSAKFFSKNSWNGRVEDRITQKPLQVSVAIRFSDGSEIIEKTDKNGNFRIEGKIVELKIKKDGYKSVSIKPLKQGGFFTIKLISSRDWALLLFKDLCKRVMPDKAGKLTPSEALNLKIPPEDLIVDLEQAVYGRKIPSEEDLLYFSERLKQQDKDKE